MNHSHTPYTLRIVRSVTRVEPWLILALVPLLMFPQPKQTPWLMALIPLLWVFRWIGWRRLTVRTPLDMPILGLLIMTAVSLWATFDMAQSFSKLCGVFLGVALFYAIVNAVRTARGVWLTTTLLLIGGAAVAGMSLIGTRWQTRAVPKVPLLVQFLSSLGQRFPLLLENMPRAEQGFNKNQVAGTMALLIPLAVALLVHLLTTSGRPETDEGQRTGNKPLSKVRHPRLRVRRILFGLGLVGMLLLTISVLLLSQSRLAYLSLALSLLLMSATRGRWPRLIAAVALLGGVGLVATYGPNRMGQAIFGMPSLEAVTEDASWIGRLEIWKRAARVIQDHPLTGIGFDTLFPVVHARYPTFHRTPAHDLAHAHNLFLQTALDVGLPGLLVFIWLLLSFGWMLWRVERSTATPSYRALATGLFFGLLAQLIFGLADAIALGQKPGIFMWAYFGLGAALWTNQTLMFGIRDPGSLGHVLQRATRKIRFTARLTLVLLAVLGLGWGYGRLMRARAWLSLIESDIAELQLLAWEGPQAIAISSPQELVQVLRTHLLGVQSEFALSLALAPHLGWLPGYGADIQAAPALLEMALDLTAIGDEALEPFDSLFANPGEEESSSLDKTRLVVQVLQNARPNLIQSLAMLEDVRRTRQTLATTRLSPVTRQWIARFDQMLPLLESGARGALALPDLLGGTEPRTYLILIQNEDELRPTGGFISGVARVVLEEGQITELVFEDSYAVDDLSRPYPDAPIPLVEIMGTELWFLRDSNWSPDFPSSARVAMVLYWLRYDKVEVDGVLALDQHSLQLLVTALQPLKLAGYSEPVTNANVMQALRESWAPSEEGPTEDWKRHRKDSIGLLLTAMVRKLQEEPDQVDLITLGWAALRALEEKHLFVYLPQGELEAIQQTGWDGAVVRRPGDYLMVVDANLGFNKANPYITESVSYTVDLQDTSRPKAQLTLVHRHEGPQTGMDCRHGSRFELTYERMMERCYWDYVRVYTPENSRLMEATPHPIPGSLLLRGEAWEGEAHVLPSELGKETFASFLVLAPQQWTETQFEYELPPGVVQQDGDVWRYRLYVQKQGGTDGNRTIIVLNLPTGAELVAASPPPTRQEENKLVYELRLQTDLELSLDWERDER